MAEMIFWILALIGGLIFSFFFFAKDDLYVSTETINDMITMENFYNERKQKL